MRSWKIIFRLIFVFLLIMIAWINNITAQVCNGSWTNGVALNYGCFYGKWIGQFNGNQEPVGCPVYPIYTSGQTNTFTFTNPVSAFKIDFVSFTTASGCGRMEIKINGIFYPLTIANLIDIPSTPACTGSIDFVVITDEGYVSSSSNSTNFNGGHGRIIINNVYASTVTISTNDPAGTLVSSPFDCLEVVPLKLVSFDGYSRNECRTILKWETETEFNIKNIEVQRSDDGIIFNKVGVVNPKGSNSQYSFVTENPSYTYFRLKINDLDGSYKYSETIYLKSSCNKALYSISPNPAGDVMEISGLKNVDRVVLLDMIGRIIKKYNYTSTNKFDLQNVPPGMYIIKVVNAGTTEATLRVVHHANH